MRGDQGVGADLVALEGLAEAHHVVEVGQQHLAQTDSASAVVPVGRPGVRQDLRPGEPQQIVQLLGGESKAAAVDRYGIEELLPRGGRQAVMQGAAAVRVDVDAVALQPVGTSFAALIDGDRYSGAAQTLCQAKTADTAANDHDVNLLRSSSCLESYSGMSLYQVNT